ncbi:MAG: hypothetical protein CVV44_00155 [Spirochaetae bacterium HGW-Spirochaetae-1]|jgi:hypothetical protein|nr:MAG: hypothetical protein CVV44_00155 [Spirochaetae bacterium HGW-Spirochaetae-1]
MKTSSNIFIISFFSIIALIIPLSADDTPVVTQTGKSPGKNEIKISRGDTNQAVKLNWENINSGTRSRIFRSTLTRGPWDFIGESTSNSYIDKTAEPGIKYWYRIQMVKGNTPPIMTVPEWGYRKIGPLKGENLNAILRSKNRNMPVISDLKQKDAAVKELAFLEKYHMNRIELSIIMFIAGSYIKNGTLIILNDFDRHTIDYGNRQVFFTKNEKYMVKFYSKKLFRIYDGSTPLHHVLTKISFGTAGNAGQYTISGLGIKEKEQQWNNGGEASIEVSLPQADSDLLLDMTLNPYYGKETYPFRRITVSTNDAQIQKLSIPRAGKYRLLIPQSNITGNKLRLQFSFPDAQTNLEMYNKPSTVAFKTLTLSERIFTQDLFTRLMNNAIFYCIPRGDKPITRKDGTVIFIPYYEAIGMSTEYFKNYSNWRSNTIMLSTSDKKLQKEMEKAEKKG